jgi:hypothetical protein
MKHQIGKLEHNIYFLAFYHFKTLIQITNNNGFYLSISNINQNFIIYFLW